MRASGADDRSQYWKKKERKQNVPPSHLAPAAPHALTVAAGGRQREDVNGKPLPHLDCAAYSTAGIETTRQIGTEDIAVVVGVSQKGD